MSRPQSSRFSGDAPASFPFPKATDRPPSCNGELGNRVVREIQSMSRRIDDLARELNCLGYFDDDLDRPRAA